MYRTDKQDYCILDTFHWITPNTVGTEIIQSKYNVSVRPSIVVFNPACLQKNFVDLLLFLNYLAVKT